MKVFVTGSSGCLAHALLPLLCADAAIERVTGIDLAPPAYEHPKFAARRLDVRTPELAGVLAGHDALIHLAFVVLRGKMTADAMFDINVNGSHALFRAAQHAGVARMIHLSSAAVYGAGTQLGENAPLQPLPQFLYAQHKTQVERLLETAFPAAVRLRPHVILGPHAQPLLKFLLRQPCYLLQRKPYPLLQCVHEDDVACAVLLALKSRACGAFNLATEETFSFREINKKRHAIGIPVPLCMARAGLNVAWRLTGWGGEPAWLDGVAESVTLDCRRARDELGWRATRTAVQTIALT